MPLDKFLEICDEETRAETILTWSSEPTAVDAGSAVNSHSPDVTSSGSLAVKQATETDPSLPVYLKNTSDAQSTRVGLFLLFPHHWPWYSRHTPAQRQMLAVLSRGRLSVLPLHGVYKLQQPSCTWCRCTVTHHIALRRFVHWQWRQGPRSVLVADARGQ